MACFIQYKCTYCSTGIYFILCSVKDFTQRIKSTKMTTKSTGIDCNAIRTIHDGEERFESSNGEFGLREPSCPYHLEVPGTRRQNFFGRTSKSESYPMTGSNESLGLFSEVGAFATDVNMRTNELFMLPRTRTDLPRAFSFGEKNDGKKAASDQRCSKETIDNPELNHSTCKYLEKEEFLVENIQDFNKSCIYSTAKTEHLQTGNSSSRTCDPSLQIGNCSLQTSNPNLHRDNSSLQTCILGSIAGNSKLQAGNNWTLSGPCKHNLNSSKRLGSDDGLSCRICHSVTDLETLVNPCLCTGSMKYVHESCLLNWLKSSVKTKCELCLHEVPVKKLVKPLREVSFVNVCV